MKPKAVNAIVLLLVTAFISAIFISMIRHFAVAVLLAGIFSAMAQPVYRTFERWFRGRKSSASLATLASVSLVVFLPLAAILGIVARQAVSISRSAKPWIESWIDEPSDLDRILQSLPFYDLLARYSDVIWEKAGELVERAGNYLFSSLSSATLSTVNFFFLFFVFIYTAFFFLREGKAILNKILYYMPMTESSERRLLDRFTSVTRATIKGTFLIGALQGTLAGLAFWVVGIDSALFWGLIMTVLSVIPALGTALVWAPAAVILAASGSYLKAGGLALFCALLVGSVDNVLRPRLVGADAKMHELMIFFGTVGGISLFGIVGFIIGPILAALFVTVWDIYGESFRDYLPEVGEAGAEVGSEHSSQAEGKGELRDD